LKATLPVDEQSNLALLTLRTDIIASLYRDLGGAR